MQAKEARPWQEELAGKFTQSPPRYLPRQGIRRGKISGEARCLPRQGAMLSYCAVAPVPLPEWHSGAFQACVAGYCADGDALWLAVQTGHLLFPCPRRPDTW